MSLIFADSCYLNERILGIKVKIKLHSLNSDIKHYKLLKYCPSPLFKDPVRNELDS